jgi:signal transduction histidine kinase
VGLTVPLWALAGAVVLIAVLDSLTPAGVVVGALLTIPIVLSGTRASAREVALVAVLAGVAFAVAALLGRAPQAPPVFWIPNRVLAVLSIPAAAAVALLLQRHRLHAERAREAAVAARDLNRVLMSLLAHDLRAPLVVARQCIGYVEEGLADGRAPDPGLLADTRARLDRSIRAIEIVLSVARTQADPDAPTLAHDGERPVRVGDEIRAEVESFAGEAALRGKRLELRLDGVSAAQPVLNPLVLRQALAILVDNAIRYAVPGVVSVSAELLDGALRVTVEDGGAADGDGGHPAPRGAGLGLELSRALLAHAGGALRRDGAGPGSAWTLTLPVARSAGADEG